MPTWKPNLHVYVTITCIWTYSPVTCESTLLLLNHVFHTYIHWKLNTTAYIHTTCMWSHIWKQAYTNHNLHLALPLTIITVVHVCLQWFTYKVDIRTYFNYMKIFLYMYSAKVTCYWNLLLENFLYPVYIYIYSNILFIMHLRSRACWHIISLCKSSTCVKKSSTYIHVCTYNKHHQADI